MAKAQKQEKTMEAALWEAINKLRGAVEPAEYKHVVLSLIFLKYASDKFEERSKEKQIVRAVVSKFRRYVGKETQKAEQGKS